MVVEPDAEVRETLVRPLRAAGHDVLEVASGADGWRSMASHPPALLMTDVGLSDVCSADLLRRMRDSPLLNTVPVVAFGNASTTPDLVAAAFDAGVVGYFVLPVSEAELLARVRATLAKRDLTSRLRASEERFRAFMDNSPAVAFIKDREGRFLYTNSVWRRQFEPEATDWFGRTEYDFWPREVADVFCASDRECLDRMAPIQLEESGPRHDGTERVWMVIKYPVPMHDDIAVGGMAWDITDRRKAEREVREYAALLDTAQHIGRMGSWTSDVATGALRWSDSTCALYGIRPDEFSGTFDQFMGFVLPEDRPGLVEALAAGDRGLASARGLIECEYRIRRPDGDVRWLFQRGHAEFDGGRPVRRLGMIIDITELKRAEVHSLRAQRMESLGTLAGGIAHDLNNVLAPILMSIDLLKASVSDPESRSAIDAIESSAERGASLIRQVLSFARGVDGQRVPVDLGRVVREVERIGRDTFPKNVELTAVPAADLWPVLGDATQLHQVLLNLVVNARDAMPRGGRVGIHVDNVVIDNTDASLNPETRAGRFVLITVTDTGMGITSDIRERVFEPFFTTKEVGKGTGLGLSTTLAIVRSHGGFIGLASEEGRGTKVTVYLPAAHQRGAPAGTDASPEKAPGGHGELVLLVDDEETIRRVGASILERFGYRVMTAADGARALSIYSVRRDDVSLVLTDLAMPVMDGIDLIRALRAVDPHLPIVASSGLAGGGTTRPSIPGADVTFLAKPYSADALLRAIRDALDNAREAGAD